MSWPDHDFERQRRARYEAFKARDEERDARMERRRGQLRKDVPVELDGLIERLAKRFGVDDKDVIDEIRRDVGPFYPDWRSTRIDDPRWPPPEGKLVWVGWQAGSFVSLEGMVSVGRWDQSSLQFLQNDKEMLYPTHWAPFEIPEPPRSKK